MSRARRTSIAATAPRPHPHGPALAWAVACAWLLVFPGLASLASAAGPSPASELGAPMWLALNDGSTAPGSQALDDATPLRSRPKAADPSGDGSEDEDAWLDDEFDLESEFDAMTDDDPFERVNRGIFAFNGEVDRFVLTPITDVYQTLVPTAGRSGVHNVFLNLDAPVRMTNAMLQGRVRASGIALARFIVNSTFGIGGLFDVGSRVGLTRQRADFGQTLASWGAPQGPYLVVPFLGPTTIRNGVGMGVDFLMQPVSYVVGPLPGMIVGAGKDFSRREQVVFEIESLRDGSLDFYAALRSAFLQDRADMLAAGQHDSTIEHVPSVGSDPTLAASSPAEREAHCLSGPRARREILKPGLRGPTQARCAAFAAHAAP